MTAQFPDHISFLGEDFVLNGLTNGSLFSPEDRGMETRSECTALQKGFSASYAIIDEVLYVTRLYINSKDGLYPNIDGVTPVDGVYEGIKMKVPYTGKIRLVKDFDRKYYVHHGYQAAAAHHTVLDLSLNDGLVTEIVDRAEDARKQRELFEQGHGKSNRDAFGFQRIWRVLAMDFLP